MHDPIVHHSTAREIGRLAAPAKYAPAPAPAPAPSPAPALGVL